MTTSDSFSGFAAQLREFIRISSVGESPEPSDSQSEFNQLALSLFALQFAHNAPYRRFCQSRQATPETVGHWTRIPAVPTAAFKEFELTCLPAAQRTRVFHSSGTTGQTPSRHFHCAESLAIYEASLLAWFRRSLPAEPTSGNQRSASGLETENRSTELAEVLKLGTFVSLTPPPEQAPKSSLVHMFSTLHRKFGAGDSVFTGLAREDGSWDLDFDRTVQALRKNTAAGQPVVLLGTAFNYVQLLDCLDLAGASLQLPPHSRAMETGGYKGRSRALPKKELHALISARLGVPLDAIFGEYGMSELSSQAYAFAGASGDGTFHFPPWARVQIISPETGREVAMGETGLLCISDVANVWSVMAVQTEDLAGRRADGFELIGRAVEAEPRGCSLMSA